MCTFTLVSTASAQNLLQNGDFAQGITGWTVGKVVGTPTPDKVCKVEVISEGTRKSGKAAHISDTDDHAGIGLYQKVPASPDTSYQLAYASKTMSPGKGDLPATPSSSFWMPKELGSIIPKPQGLRVHLLRKS